MVLHRQNKRTERSELGWRFLAKSRVLEQKFD
jgi:hypothetical protein